MGETVELWKLRLRQKEPRHSTATVVGALTHRVGEVLSVNASLDRDGPIWEVVLEAPEGTRAEAVLAGLSEDGLWAVARPADVHDFLNPRARCLALVEEVRRQPHRLADVAAQLLDAQVLTGPDDVLESATTPGETLELTRAGHTFARLRRRGLAFSCGETAEVQALARLASPDDEQGRSEHWLALRDGHEVTVRTARPRDRGFVRALQGSRSLRVLGSSCPGSDVSCADQERGGKRVRSLATLVATAPDGERVAASRLFPSSDDEAEVCLVVQERWQRWGLGAALVLHSLLVARHHGLTRLRTMLHGSDVAMQRSFREAGATLTRVDASPRVAVSLPTEMPAVEVVHPGCSDGVRSCAGNSVIG